MIFRNTNKYIINTILNQTSVYFVTWSVFTTNVVDADPIHPDAKE